MVGCVKDGQEMAYRILIADVVEWYQANYLLLNMNKGVGHRFQEEEDSSGAHHHAGPRGGSSGPLQVPGSPLTM